MYSLCHRCFRRTAWWATLCVWCFTRDKIADRLAKTRQSE